MTTKSFKATVLLVRTTQLFDLMQLNKKWPPRNCQCKVENAGEMSTFATTVYSKATQHTTTLTNLRSRCAEMKENQTICGHEIWNWVEAWRRLPSILAQGMATKEDNDDDDEGTEAA